MAAKDQIDQEESVVGADQQDGPDLEALLSGVVSADDSEEEPGTASDDDAALPDDDDAKETADADTASEDKDEKADDVDDGDDDEAADSEAEDDDVSGAEDASEDKDEQPLRTSDGRPLKFGDRELTDVDLSRPELRADIIERLDAGENPHAFWKKSSPLTQENSALKSTIADLEGQKRQAIAENHQLKIDALVDEAEPSAPDGPDRDEFYEDGLFKQAEWETAKQKQAGRVEKWRVDIHEPWKERQDARAGKRAEAEAAAAQSAEEAKRVHADLYAAFEKVRDDWFVDNREPLKLTDADEQTLHQRASEAIAADIERGGKPSPYLPYVVAGLTVENDRLRQQLETIAADAADSTKRSVKRAADSPAGGKRTGTTEKDAGPMTLARLGRQLGQGQVTKEQFDAAVEKLVDEEEAAR